MPFGFDFPDLDALNPFDEDYPDETPAERRRRKRRQRIAAGLQDGPDRPLPPRSRDYDVPIPASKREDVRKATREAKLARAKAAAAARRAEADRDPDWRDYLHGAAAESKGFFPGLLQVTTEGGTAGYKDIRNTIATLQGEDDPYPWTMRRSPKTGKLIIAKDPKTGKPIPTGGHLAELLFGTADVAATETARTVKDVGVLAAARLGGVKTLEQFNDSYAEWLDTKATQAEKRIAAAPLSTAATFFWGAGQATKLATIPAMTARMVKLNPGMSKAAARAAATAEHRNPGVAKALGIKGGMPPRTIRGRGPTAKGRVESFDEPLATGRPWSRTPGGRAGQTIYDEASRLIDRVNPNLYFSAGKRAGRIESRRDAQRQKAADADNATALEAIGDVVEGTSRLSKARSVLGMGRPIRERAEALIAALEGPQDATIRESVEARIASLEDTLAKSEALQPQANAIKVLRARLKRGDLDEEGRKEVSTELKKVIAELDANLGKGVAPVRGSKERRNAIRAWERHFGKNGKPTNFSKRKAQFLAVFADHLARAQNPENPQEWYRTHLAEVTSEKAQAFLARADTIAAQFQSGPGARFGLTTPRGAASTESLGGRLGVTLLNQQPDGRVMFTQGGRVFVASKEGSDRFYVTDYKQYPDGEWDLGGEDGYFTSKETRHLLNRADSSTFDAGGDLEDAHSRLFGTPDDTEVPVFYSELQRHVEKLPGQQMVAQSLRKRLKHDISDVEWSAMGMDAFFFRYKPTERVPYTELNQYLSDPLNAYNLDEVVFGGGNTGKFRDRFGENFGDPDMGDFPWSLVSKKLEGDEKYYELVMSLPARGDQTKDYTGSHWHGITNPIVHIRFAIRNDTTGKKSIVIDEIQSDWASAERKKREAAKQRQDAGLEPEADVWQLSDAEISERRDAAVEARSQFWRDHPEVLELDNLAEDMGDAADDLQGARKARESLQDESHTQDEWTEAVAEERDAQLAYDHARQKYDEEAARIPQELLVEKERLIAEAWKWIMAEDNNLRERRHVPFELGETHLDAAVRRVMRWAHDSDTDRIIIMPGQVHAYRYGSVLESPSGRGIAAPRVNISAHLDGVREFRGMDVDAMTAHARKHAIRTSEEAKTFFRIYEELLPNLFAKHIGHKGQWMEGIIDARYTDEAMTFESEVGSIGAWVIDMGEEGMRRASIPMRQFQHQPEWDALPRGARELLEDGRQAMRLFEGADVDTVIHELAHIALSDVDDATRAILERHFGGKVEDWNEGQNEAYARGFESYVRTGRAQSVFLASAFSVIAKWMRNVWAELYHGRTEDFDLDPELAGAFDRILGYKGVPTVLSKTERGQVRSQIESLTKALDEPLESEEYQAALAALEMLSEQIEEAGTHILTRNASPEQEAAIREGLAKRRDLVTTRMAEQGVLPGEWTPETRARGYFPQTSIWDIQGMPQAGPVRMAATGDVVGAPRLDSKALMRRPNRLIRYSTGEVLNDPAVLVKVLRARMRYIATLNAREQLWAKGKPIKKGQAIPKYGVALVRNPNVTPEKIRDDIHAALRLPPERYSELEMRGKMDDIDEAEVLQEAAEDIIWLPGMGAKPHWVSDTANVRTVPAAVAKTRLGDVFTSPPKGWGHALAGGANAMARLAAIYLPWGGTRYVVRNAAQNAVLLALTQPTALARIGRAHAKYKRDHPEDYHRIMAEGGTILGTALPEFNTRPQGRIQEAERYINERTQASGSFLGKFADNPFRWASWTKHAERYGFHGPDGYNRLLRDDRYTDVRETVMQRTRDDMIDFDTLSPFEKEVLARYFFLWPFIRGITKWPFMYFREYPGRVAAAMTLPQPEEGDLSTGAVRDRLLMGGRDFGWLDPTGPALENVERGVRIARGKEEISLSAVADMLAPQYRELIQSFSDRQGKTWKQSMANTFVPGASTYNAIKRGGSPIEMMDRYLGQSTEPPMSVVNQREGRAAEINHYLDEIEKRGFSLPDDKMRRLMAAHNAYEKYKELSARAGFGLRDQGKNASLAADGPNHRLRAAILFAVADEFYPGKMPITLEDYDDLTAKQKDAFYNDVEDAMWGYREDFLSKAKEAFDK